KVADAITPIASTVRPGRSDAFRTPSRHTVDSPACAGCEGARRFSQAATPQSDATSSAEPAPKNDAVGSTNPPADAASSAAPTSVQTAAATDAYERLVPGRVACVGACCANAC